jgi:hypothetical protein
VSENLESLHAIKAMKYWVLLVIMILSAPVYGQTESSESEVKKIEDVIEQLSKDQQKSGKTDDQSSESDHMMPVPPGSLALDEETHAAYLKSLRAYYNYRATGLEHRRSVFRWQLLSSKVIFAVVLLLVGLGMYFAAIQFKVDLKGNGKNEKGGGGQATDIELSAKGIKVTSPVLGVVVLTLSLGFFYLYLVYVYPIEDIF